VQFEWDQCETRGELHVSQQLRQLFRMVFNCVARPFKDNPGLASCLSLVIVAKKSLKQLAAMLCCDYSCPRVCAARVDNYALQSLTLKPTPLAERIGRKRAGSIKRPDTLATNPLRFEVRTTPRWCTRNSLIAIAAAGQEAWASKSSSTAVE